jgi:hypothetical protein
MNSASRVAMQEEVMVCIRTLVQLKSMASITTSIMLQILIKLWSTYGHLFLLLVLLVLLHLHMHEGIN